MKKNIFSSVLIVLLLSTTIHAQDNWNNQNPASRPPGMAGHAMAYIGDDKVLIFGGENGETWVYDLSDNSWTQKITTDKPSLRFYHAMASFGGDQVLLYGGCSDPFGSDRLGDTWVYDLSDNAWTLKNPSTSPSARFAHAMASVGGDQILLFGGNTSGGRNGETWVFDLSDNSWSQKFPATDPGWTSGHAMANIGGDKVVMTGTNSIAINNTWVFDLSDNNWTLKNPATNPSPRQAIGMASIGGDKTLLFGGLDNPGGGSLDDTWTYDLSDDAWTLGSPASRPSERQLYAMASIGTNKVLLFGGAFPVSDETWLYTATVQSIDCQQDKIQVCHNGNTICVSANAVAAHLAHGDHVGQCSTNASRSEGLEKIEIVEQGFNVYPNPGYGDFIVTFNLTGDEVGEKIIRIINASGQTVQTLNTHEQNRLNIRIKAQGIYWIQLQTSKEVITKKIIVLQ